MRKGSELNPAKYKPSNKDRKNETKQKVTKTKQQQNKISLRILSKVQNTQQSACTTASLDFIAI